MKVLDGQAPAFAGVITTLWWSVSTSTRTAWPLLSVIGRVSSRRCWSG